MSRAPTPDHDAPAQGALGAAPGDASADHRSGDSAVRAAPPLESPARPRHEAEVIVHAASPGRLALRVAGALTLLGLVVGGAQLLRLRARALEARATVMLSLPGGTFRMGAGPDGPPESTPAHLVTVGPFRIDRTEVTVAAYRRCVEAGGCTPPPPENGCSYAREGREDHPITCVDWRQASAYCAWTGKRLPTEEEWEFAARGLGGRRFPWGDAPPDASRLNACDRACQQIARASANVGGAPLTLHDDSDGWGTTAPVGRYPAGDSPFGLKDMAGNVAEWTTSAFCPYRAGARVASPLGEDRCAEPQKVTRGGAWSDPFPASFEASARRPLGPTGQSVSLGFRCAQRDSAPR